MSEDRCGKCGKSLSREYTIPERAKAGILMKDNKFLFRQTKRHDITS